MSSRSSQVCKAFGAVVLPLMIGIGGNWAIVPPASQAIAQTTQDRKAEAERLLELGFQQYSKSEYRAALGNFQKAVVLFRAINDRAGEGQSLNNIGVTYARLGQYAKALDFYQQSLRILKTVNYHSSTLNTLVNIGTVYDSLEQYTQALEFFQQALTIAKTTGDRQIEGTLLNKVVF